jgi:hypothetical protein
MTEKQGKFELGNGRGASRPSRRVALRSAPALEQKVNLCLTAYTVPGIFIYNGIGVAADGDGLPLKNPILPQRPTPGPRPPSRFFLCVALVPGWRPPRTKSELSLDRLRPLMAYTATVEFV